MTSAARKALYALELALARRHVDAIPGGYDAVLDDAFLEYGASGRTWTRAEILDLLVASPRDDAVSIEDFDLDEVGQGVYLVRYDSVGVLDGRTVRRHRSSLWLRRGDGFVLRFHQGTPVPDDG